MSGSYFIGAGIHTALGLGVADNLAALRRPPSTPPRVAVEYAGREETVPYQLLARAPLVDIEQRLDQVLESIVAEALGAADLTSGQRSDTGLFVGTSSADITLLEARYRCELQRDKSAIPIGAGSSVGNISDRLHRRFGLQGPDYSFNTACTASANALLYADEMLANGRISHALVVGVELFNVVTANGFCGLQLLAGEAMKPFDRTRDGLVLGEACSALVLGREPRGTSGFRLRGGATLCDTHSVSAANPDGSTIAAVMSHALTAAQLAPRQVSALKVHGTASRLSDEAEVAGMRRVFADLPPLCAVKPFIGHTLGACGLTELVLFCAAAEQGFLIGTPGICARDSDLEVTLNQQSKPLAPGHFMLNYFGFGGNNTSLIASNLDT